MPDDRLYWNHPRSGWFILTVLVLLASFVWIQAVPTYLRYYYGSTGPTSTVDIPGDGTIPGRRKNETAIVFFNVKYGDGILIQGPNNTTSLIDGGEGQYPESSEAYAFDFGHRLYLPFFRQIGKTHFENFISTVPFSHHMGVQPDLLAKKDIKVDNVYWTGYQARFGAHRRFRVHASQKSKFQVLRAGDSVDMGDGIESKVLHAKYDVKVKQKTSRVILSKYGSVKFLLMSDLPSKFEKELALRWGRSLQSDLVKVGTHGSSASNSKKFLNFVNPNYAVISVSAKNPLGAPHEETLENLREVGTQEILRTSRNGHIAFYTDGTSLRVETRVFSFL
ncbi:MAG: ComEC/Rec2 family competence protein [bacterium]